ncbi:hypothetical protein AA0535_1929 [Asaia krungthepensis NRIC 0535]|uniref:Uncharacterized protein n=1 Tax=Asaia krungthepensis NRIC 0535 TaxID=1307925 RepID=A0ABQ0Q3R2_9PROT|nr:hypothetical protein AA0535_1929 [Asaia krungthepensis NRIC 0535]
MPLYGAQPPREPSQLHVLTRHAVHRDMARSNCHADMKQRSRILIPEFVEDRSVGNPGFRSSMAPPWDEP